MADNFANNFQTTLTNGVDADDTAWTVGGSTDAPAVPFKCALFNSGDVTEIITVTAAAGTSWTVTRASEVTAGFSGGQSHSAGAVIKHVLTAGSLVSLTASNSLDYFYNAISADVTLTSVDTYFDGPSLSLEAGTYFLSGAVTIDRSTGGSPTAKLWDGTQVVSSGRADSSSDFTDSIHLSGTIVLPVARTVKISVACNTGTALIKANTDVNNAGNNASFLTAIDLESAHTGSGVGARATITATSVPTATFHPIPLDTEDFDTDGFHSTVTNTSRMTVPAGLGGKYIAVADVETPNNTSGVRYFMIYKNGSEYAAIKDDAPTQSGGFGFKMTPTAVLKLVPGDYIELYVFQNSGSSLSYNASLSIMRLDSLPSKYTGPQWGSGTAFPTSPVTDDRFTRTDLGMDFYYDGTRWLSTEIHHIAYDFRDTGTFPVSANGSFYAPAPIPVTASHWFIGIMFSSYVTATNDGGNFWTITPTTGGGAAFTTAADGADVLTTHYVAVGAAITTANSWKTFSATKTGGPGALWIPATYAFRYIGT